MSSDPLSSDRLLRTQRSLFLVSVIALVTTGVGFSIRGNIAGEMQTTLFDPIDKLRSAEMVATALGIVFLGFACTIAIGSPLLDYIGMGRLLILSSLCYFAGTGLVVFSQHLQGALSLYALVCLGMLIIGIGQGLVETVINPLTASLYTEEKTRRLNTLHAWWPGGIIMGGLLGLAMTRLHLNWQIQMGLVAVPAAVFGAMTLGQKFPPTELVAAGVSAS